ncbi:PP2C family protein-serine/threonine phosphatase [Actinophytocola sp.]|uniref:PP2C family protein-serine/threonine phosphatase n=1 Tax=Actinophytocola sp. TaxID=1872138 RepID=UPI002ED558F8
MRFEAAAGSDVGRRYAANFDVLHVSTEPLLAVVADGMGDSRGSALAGRATVDTVVEGITGEVTPDLLRAVVARAQDTVIEIGRGDVGLAGCTLTALTGGPDGLWIVQVGDSRVYRLRGGLLELLTVDHTMAWLGAVHGWYPFDSREARNARYHLTRYIGHPDRPAPDVLSVAPAAGDVYLLCTDGVAEQVPYARIAEVLGTRAPEPAVRELLAAADAAGGDDNATAVVVAVR